MSIPREAIDPEADKVVRRLRRCGHAAYLVGGCVRDLLLARRPKDFDVATSATPQEIKDIFRNCRIIGRRFRLAHIFFGAKIIETSTFRSNPREGMTGEDEEELLIRRDNVFGTAEEDARRRDFTINGLFYDVEAGEVIDYVGGLADLEGRLVRTIGEPDIRFREDPVRILRAIKFAARLGFSIEPATYQAILTHRHEIAKSAPPRVLEEVYRLLRGGAARASVELLLQTDVATILAPELARIFGAKAHGLPETANEGGTIVHDEAGREFAWRLLSELDSLAATSVVPMSNFQALGEEASPAERPRDHRRAEMTNALLIGTLVAPFLPKCTDIPDGRHHEHLTEVETVLGPLVTRLGISRRDGERTRQILLAQRRLAPPRRRRARPMALLRRDHFLEALTLYDLVSRATGQNTDEVDRWHRLFTKGGDAPHAPEHPPMSPDEGPGGEAPRKRRRRGSRRRRSSSALTNDASPMNGEAAPRAATPPIIAAGTDGREPE